MENYVFLEQIAAGSYGLVYSARNKSNGRLVAIKVLERRHSSWDEAEQERDIEVLSTLPVHPNCVSLLDKFYEEGKLCLVFDFFNCTLLQLLETHKLNAFEHRNLAFKLLEGLFHLHENSLMHRDLKPENVLVKHPECCTTELTDFTLASARLVLCDFGLTKNERQKPHSDYVSTRWYRAPEQLLGFTDYDCKVDVFAAGCVLAEMCNGTPIFEGKSQLDQIQKIAEICGTPQPIGSPKLKQICERLRELKAASKAEKYSKALCRENLMLTLACSEKLADLLANMLNWDPIDRFSIQQCLSHGYFAID